MHAPQNALLAALALSASPLVHATLAYVSDEALDQMRGRYVAAGEIISFGVALTTTWKDNTQTNAIVTQFNLLPNGSAQLNAYKLNGTPDSANQGAPTPGLASVKGIVQVNQQAGNANQSVNNAGIDISTQSSGAPAPLASPGSNWTAIDPNNVLSPDGTLHVRIDQGAKGMAGQELGKGQLLQYSSINGSGISASNSLALMLTLRPGQSANQTQALSAMRSLLVGLH